MPGVLQFTLGLEASKFLETIGLSGHKLLELAGAGELLKKAIEGTWGQIEKGAALQELSKRTGESVATLYQLQKGFTAAGLSADDLGGAIFMLNKSLGGVNDMGEDTASIFEKVGLSSEKLKSLGSAGAMQDILQKMSQMDQTTATAFASKIFGRGEAQSMVQLSRSMAEFRQGMSGAAAQAQVFQRIAEIFNAIERAVEKVKHKLDPLFLVLAEKVAPVLKQVLDWVNSIDLTPLGDGLAEVWDIFANAFSQGKILELLSTGFDAAVEYLGNLIFGMLGDASFWMGIVQAFTGAFDTGWAVILKSFLNLGVILKAVFLEAMEVWWQALGKIPGLGKLYGLSGYKAHTFAETYAEERDKASGANKMLNEYFTSGATNLLGGAKDIGAAFQRSRALAGKGQSQKALDDLLWWLRPEKGLHPKGSPEEAGTEHYDLANQKDDRVKGEKVQSSELERMGFVFGGGAGGGPAATTAKNTTKMVNQLTRLIDLAKFDNLAPERNALPG